MKKLCSVILGCLLGCICLTTGGCSTDEYSELTVDLSKMEIGTEIPVYPGHEFDYSLTPESELYPDINDEYTYHVSAITAKLIRKNSIAEGDVISEQFFPFEIQIAIAGSTSPELAGYTFSAKICCQTSFIDIAGIDFQITDSGSFEGSTIFGVYDANPAPLYFALISKFFW